MPLFTAYIYNVKYRLYSQTNAISRGTRPCASTTFFSRCVCYCHQTALRRLFLMSTAAKSIHLSDWWLLILRNPSPPLQFYHLPNHSLSLCVLQSNFCRRNRSRNVDLLWNLTQSNSSTLKRDRKNNSLVVLVIQLALSALHCLQIWAFTIDDNEDKGDYFTVWKHIF